MRVIVVGAGIAGLSLAISLGQAGHQVTILECAPALAEIGAGVQMTPNAIKCFFDLGLKDDLMAKSAIPGHMNIRHGKQGHVLGSIAKGGLENTYGAPYILIHRAILHDILHKYALKAGAQVRLNSKVVQYLFESGNVVLSTGETVSADLVIAADGINSSARSHLLGPSDPGTAPTGWAGYRLMATVSAIKSYPSLSSIAVSPSYDSNLWIGPNQSAMTYLIKDATMLNIVLSHRDNIDTTNWSTERYQAEVKATFEGWDPRLRQLLDISLPKITNYPAHHVPPLPTWIHPSGRFCLLGDAAHAMAFYLSMGVSLAVEDAAALTEALRLTTASPSSPPSSTSSSTQASESSSADAVNDSTTTTTQAHLKLALSLFESVRKPRCEAVQAASTHAGDILHLDPGPEQEIRDEGLRRTGEYWLMNENDVEEMRKREWVYGLSDKRTRDWCYGYDAKMAVREEWERMRREDRLK